MDGIVGVKGHRMQAHPNTSLDGPNDLVLSAALRLDCDETFFSDWAGAIAIAIETKLEAMWDKATASW